MMALACECSIPKVMKGPILSCGQVTELLVNELGVQGVAEAGFPFWTALGLLHAESGGFHICARGPTCDYGLAQLNALCPACFPETSPYNEPPEECFNPDDHITSRVWFDPRAAVWCVIGHYKVKGGARGWMPWAVYNLGIAQSRGDWLRRNYCVECSVPTAQCTAPAPGPPPTQAPRQCQEGCTKSYTVQPGDTFAAIASRNGMTVQQLRNLNPQIVDPNLIYPGDCICLSLAAPAPPPVQLGELAGLVHDLGTGLPITGADVVLEGQTPGTAAHREVVTFTDGVYYFADLPPGLYRLRAGAQGYQTWETTVLIVNMTRLTMDIGLAPVQLPLQLRNAVITAVNGG